MIGLSGWFIEKFVNQSDMLLCCIPGWIVSSIYKTTYPSVQNNICKHATLGCAIRGLSHEKKQWLNFTFFYFENGRCLSQDRLGLDYGGLDLRCYLGRKTPRPWNPDVGDLPDRSIPDGRIGPISLRVGPEIVTPAATSERWRFLFGGFLPLCNGFFLSGLPICEN